MRQRETFRKCHDKKFVKLYVKSFIKTGYVNLMCNVITRNTFGFSDLTTSLRFMYVVKTSIIRLEDTEKIG